MLLLFITSHPINIHCLAILDYTFKRTYWLLLIPSLIIINGLRINCSDFRLLLRYKSIFESLYKFAELRCFLVLFIVVMIIFLITCMYFIDIQWFWFVFVLFPLLLLLLWLLLLLLASWLVFLLFVLSWVGRRLKFTINSHRWSHWILSRRLLTIQNFLFFIFSGLKTLFTII